MNRVDVVIKATRAGVAIVTPYNPHDGLQFYRPIDSLETRVVRYRVPAYEVLVSDMGEP